MRGVSTRAAVERSAGSASAARLAYFKCAGTAVAAGAACETEAANDRHTSAVSPRKRPWFIDPCASPFSFRMSLSEQLLCHSNVTYF